MDASITEREDQEKNLTFEDDYVESEEEKEELIFLCFRVLRFCFCYCFCSPIADAFSIIPASVLRNLSDKLCEKRKNAALEVGWFWVCLFFLFFSFFVGDVGWVDRIGSWFDLGKQHNISSKLYLQF